MGWLVLCCVSCDRILALSQFSIENKNQFSTSSLPLQQFALLLLSPTRLPLAPFQLRQWGCGYSTRSTFPAPFLPSSCVSRKRVPSFREWFIMRSQLSLLPPSTIWVGYL